MCGIRMADEEMLPSLVCVVRWHLKCQKNMNKSLYIIILSYIQNCFKLIYKHQSTVNNLHPYAWSIKYIKINTYRYDPFNCKKIFILLNILCAEIHLQTSDKYAFFQPMNTYWLQKLTLFYASQATVSGLCYEQRSANSRCSVAHF